MFAFLNEGPACVPAVLRVSLRDAGTHGAAEQLPGSHWMVFSLGSRFSAACLNSISRSQTHTQYAQQLIMNTRPAQTISSDIPESQVTVGALLPTACVIEHV